MSSPWLVSIGPVELWPGVDVGGAGLGIDLISCIWDSIAWSSLVASICRPGSPSARTWKEWSWMTWAGSGGKDEGECRAWTACSRCTKKRTLHSVVCLIGAPLRVKLQ